MDREFKEGDVVRIFKQPTTQHVPLVGKVGFIDEVGAKHVSFSELTVDGSCGGGGCVPKSHLEPVTDAKWISAKEARDRKMDSDLKAFEERSEKIREATKVAKRRAAEEFGLTPEKVERVVNGYSKMLGEELDKAGVHQYY